jgi:predicted RNA-binding protein with TRAM domain
MTRLSLCLLATSLGGVVTLAAAPAAPTNLVVTVTGSTVALTWTAPPGVVFGYRLEAGTAPGLSNVASSLVGTATTFTATAVPAGTYYVRVRAVGDDGEGPASNEATVTVASGGTCTSAPNPPAALTSAVTGMLVTLAWASGGGCAATNYVVQAGTAPGLSNLATVNAGVALGLSATAPTGTYYVRVVAQNAFGSSPPSNQVTVLVGGSTTPLPPLDWTVAVDTAVRIAITMPATGLYHATLTWADPSIDLDLYLARPGCNFYPPLPCLLVVSDRLTGNSEDVAWPVRAGETYELWVDNWSNRGSAFVIQHSIRASDGSALTLDESHVAAVRLPRILKSRSAPR